MNQLYRNLIRRCRDRAAFHRQRADALLRIGRKSEHGVAVRYKKSARSAHYLHYRYLAISEYLHRRYEREYGAFASV